MVAYNRIRGFADAIDTFGSPRCSAIDIHNNDLSELTDDGIEMDYSERNTRCFHNRLTNVFQGISLQPVHGGPVYVFRNAMYNVAVEPFKLHNGPSGAPDLPQHVGEARHHRPCSGPRRPVHHGLSRNNLFVGTAADYAMDYTAPMVNCDFDYDGFAGGPFKLILRWNGVRYGSLDELRRRAPVLRHARLLDTASLFAAGTRPPEDVAKVYRPGIDLGLSARSKAVDAGQAMPGLEDAHRGSRPDLGAYELGEQVPHYGPRSQAPRTTAPANVSPRDRIVAYPVANSSEGPSVPP